MITTQALSDMLKRVNVQEVARAAGVSSKTIYRLRQGVGNSPTLRTVGKILAALRLSGVDVDAQALSTLTTGSSDEPAATEVRGAA